jgi:hypothetical protein
MRLSERAADFVIKLFPLRPPVQPYVFRNNVIDFSPPAPPTSQKMSRSIGVRWRIEESTGVGGNAGKSIA